MSDTASDTATRFFGVLDSEGQVTMVGGTVAAPGPDWRCQCGVTDSWELKEAFWRAGDEFIFFRPSTGSRVYPYHEGFAKCTPKELWMCPICRDPAMFLYMPSLPPRSSA